MSTRKSFLTRKKADLLKKRGKTSAKPHGGQDFSSVALNVPQYWGNTSCVIFPQSILQPNFIENFSESMGATCCQGIALLQHGQINQNKNSLLLASKFFKKSIAVNDSHFLAWMSWGEALSSLYYLCQELHFLLKAKEKYEKAFSCMHNQTTEIIAALHTQYGHAMTSLFSHSQELCDLHIALKAFESALFLYNKKPPKDFWKNYGDTTLQIAMHSNSKKMELYSQSIESYKKELYILQENTTKNSTTEIWHNLGIVFSKLHEHTYDKNYFSQGNDCFARAAPSLPHDTHLWRNWASLLLHAGRRWKQAKYFHAGLEKISKAFVNDPGKVKTFIIWVEILTDLALITEKLPILLDGYHKALEAQEKFGQIPETCFMLGYTLIALGKYYRNSDYYYQAIEKFQEGLSICRTHHSLWFQIGRAYKEVSELEESPKELDQAKKFIHKAIDLQWNESKYHVEYAHILAKMAENKQDLSLLQSSLQSYERAFHLQIPSLAIPVDWIFQYGVCLDLMGDLTNNDMFYLKSLDILNHILLSEPNYPHIHYKIAIIYFHLGELSKEKEIFNLSLSHYKTAHQKDEENDNIMLDWGITLINKSQLENEQEKESILLEAEYMLTQAVKLGSEEAFYYLACLYSLTKQYKKAMYFLHRSEDSGSLPQTNELLTDDWLENLRKTELFHTFINSIIEE